MRSPRGSISVDGQRTSSGWLSIELHTSHSAYSSYADMIARTVVWPLVSKLKENRWSTQFFFIRYNERGPHIRLRFKLPDLESAREVRDFVEDYLREGSGKATPFLGGTSIPNEGVGTNHNWYEWTEYQPETYRYGGPRALIPTHLLFESCSLAALKIIESLTEDRRKRIAKALLAMVILTHAFGLDGMRAAAWFNTYSNNYKPKFFGANNLARVDNAFDKKFHQQGEAIVATVTSVRDRLRHRLGIAPGLDQLALGARDFCNSVFELVESGHIETKEGTVRSWPEFLGKILPSHVHMMNNRLGILPAEEGFLAHMLDRSLRMTCSLES